jgi:D-glucosaminate-6-phosphate ammonia-lyase
MKKSISRRHVFRTGGAAAALGLAPLPAAAAKVDSPEVYTRIGARPFINLTATLTINGGALTLPEVKEAMEGASHWPMNLDELMAKVGVRIAELLGSESAIVTSGCAAALANATAGIITGGDPEKMQQLPDLTGLKNEVIIPKACRNVYDHAIRMVGVRMIEVETLNDVLGVVNARTALIAVLGTGEPRSKVKLEQLAEVAKKAGIPVLVDAAAELPVTPNPYLSRGADLVAYSGGKYLRGPQCAGMLLGRKNLVQAAWINSAPHHAFGRSMKVGKEEIMGMLAAVEVWKKKDVQAEYRMWESWLSEIGSRVSKIPGVKTEAKPPAGASPFPVLTLEWDKEQIGYTAGEIGKLLLDGSPRIMSHAGGAGNSFVIRPVAMKAGESKLVAKRLEDILKAAPKPKPNTAAAAPAANMSGNWNVTIDFVAGSTRHQFALRANGNTLSGTHAGRISKGELRGSIDGNKVRLRSSLPFEGTRLTYEFSGILDGNRLSGEVSLGEYGMAKFSARRGGGAA